MQVSGKPTIGSTVSQYFPVTLTINNLTYLSLSINGGKSFLHMIPWNNATTFSLGVSAPVALWTSLQTCSVLITSYGAVTEVMRDI